MDDGDREGRAEPTGRPAAAGRATAEARADRLKAALKANIGRRKAQARAKIPPGGDDGKEAS